LFSVFLSMMVLVCGAELDFVILCSILFVDV